MINVAMLLLSNNKNLYNESTLLSTAVSAVSQMDSKSRNYTTAPAIISHSVTLTNPTNCSQLLHLAYKWHLHFFPRR